MQFDDIKIAPFDNLLVYQKGYTAEMVKRIITERKLGGLRVFCILAEDKLDTLDFLNEYDFLENLSITSLRDYDFSFLHKLIHLKKLSIHVEGTSNIHLGHLQQLEHLAIQWRKNTTGIENCRKLSTLALIEYKEKNLVKINALTNLEELIIKTGAIESLEGMETVRQLKKMVLGNCKKLSSVQVLNGLQQLKKLHIERCSAIKDYHLLTNLPALEELDLIDCKSVTTIQFINGSPLLTKLSLLGNTVVEDGDMVPAQKVLDVSYAHKKHYNVKLKTPISDQRTKDNLAMIKNSLK